jgi:hypothetical protein
MESQLTQICDEQMPIFCNRIKIGTMVGTYQGNYFGIVIKHVYLCKKSKTPTHILIIAENLSEKAIRLSNVRILSEIKQ